MKIYRVLGAWYHLIESEGPRIWTREPGGPGLMPYCPLGIDEEVFEKYMQYCNRLGRWTFNRRDPDKRAMFLAASQSEINARAQGRKFYSWVPKTVEAARLRFDLAWVIKASSPTITYEMLEEYDFRTCWMVYEDTVWWAWQPHPLGLAAEYFERSAELGSQFLFLSRDHHVGPCWPDRIHTCYLWHGWITSNAQVKVVLFYRAAAIYLGLADHIGPNLYRLKPAFRERALCKAPSDVWKYW